jgi:hypothetical protein
MTFKVQEHIIPCQHIQQEGSSEGSQPKRLSIKQYTPLSNPSPSSGDLTIIAAHANGFVKVISHPSSHGFTH